MNPNETPKPRKLTQRQVAAEVGISLSTLHAAKQEGVNPYDIEAVRRYRDNGRYCEKRDGRR